MLHIKKKQVLHDLAVTLHLMLEFNPDITSLSLMERIRKKARDAVKDAEFYTGKIGDKDVQMFVAARQFKFTIPCGKDIIKGDTIRFIETVENNRLKPARKIGTRGVIAEVTSIHYPEGGDPILYMNVIKSRGIWELKSDIPIRRTMRKVTRMEVMRAPWENEGRREALKKELQYIQYQNKNPPSRSAKRPKPD